MKKVITTLAVIAIIFSCKKKDHMPATAPVVTTAAITNITVNSATAGGSIVSDGGAAVTKSGVVWSKTNNTPTFKDSVVAGTTANGTFTSNITGLDFNLTYYVRAFAINSVDTAYGNVVSFSTTNDSTKVRFTYNGQEVIYGIIISPTSGKKWLDRSLGAKRVATSWDDYQAYGDLFQWGRPADGHQLMNWTSSTTGTPVNGTTTILATTDTPGHSNFILAPNDASSLYDWRSDNNSNRWVTAPQGPCPAGWHVPTRDEWRAEVSNTAGGGATGTDNNGTATTGGIIDRNTAYSLLKITISGYRVGTDDGTGGTLGMVGVTGWYWSSSDKKGLNPYSSGSEIHIFGPDVVQMNSAPKSDGFCVRCIHDN